MKNGQRTLICVDLPPLCIDKGRSALRLLRKQSSANARPYSSLPYRQMISRDCDMSLPESTIRDAFKQGVFLLGAIVNRMEDIALKSNYVQMDESTIKVMIEPTQGKIPSWLHDSSPCASWKQIILFDYQKTRNVERGVKKLLGIFKVTLQSDGLNRTNHCKDLKLTPAGCMDHCREVSTKPWLMIKLVLPKALDLIRPLYAWKKLLVSNPWVQRRALPMRKKKSVSVFQAFIAWCSETLSWLPQEPNR